jgi:hypothetical protein
VLQVLPEAHAAGVDARAAKQQPGATDEVGERFIGDDASRHGVTQGHRLRLLLFTCDAWLGGWGGVGEAQGMRHTP